MDELVEKRLRLALRILSGSVQIDDLGMDEYNILGFYPYNFYIIYYGVPSNDDIKLRAEEIIYEQIRSKE